MLAVAFGDGTDVAPVVSRAGFGGGQGHDRRTRRDLFEQVRGDVAAGALEQAGRHNGGVDVWFDHQRVTERFGDEHHLDRSATDAAVLLRQRGAENAQFLGESPPDLRLPARTRLGGAAAGLEAVSGRQELGQSVAQKFLFVVEFEVHVTVPYSPRAALARILR